MDRDTIAEAAQPPEGRAGGSREFLLQSLADFELLTPAMGMVHAEAASVCLADQQHPVRVSLAVENHDDSQLAGVVLLRLDITDRMRHSYKDERRTTDLGAVGIALLLTRHFTGIECATQSDTSTGIDYYFGTPSSDPSNPFKGLLRLEVTGIRAESKTNKPKYRVTEKLERLKKYQTTMPAMVAVVEFSQPLARLAESPVVKFLTIGAMSK